ncbi:MAG: alpha/beta fold hydrolase [Dehalococcoidia bacterium]
MTMTASPTWTEELLRVAGTRLQLVKAGNGSPVLVLHDEMGNAGWLRFYDKLALGHEVFLPSHPGFDRSERLDWITSVRDLTAWYLRALEDLKLGPVPVIGVGLGGWLAAEMAALCPHAFTKLVLIAPPGIKPPEGEIFDMFLVPAQPYIDAGFFRPEQVPEYQTTFGGDVSPEERERREVAREQACRLTWKPYMHDPALPHLLERVTLPALILWGREDAIVPLSAGEAYHRALDHSRLVILDDCGHHPEIEQADKAGRLIEEFLAE